MKLGKKSLVLPYLDFCLSYNITILSLFVCLSVFLQVLPRQGSSLDSLVPSTVLSISSLANICWVRAMFMGSDAYFTTMWQQTTELFPPLNKEFSQDEYSPNCTQWCFQEWNYRRPSFSMVFLHCLNNSMFFPVKYSIHREKYSKRL